ncbi:MAG: hypothetical protein DRG11_06355 [Epsilonproteobacteria bacterium]|nr:MAG: hypothetical protein DRG11_06355 [Campylobacterota bacterium]
MPQKPIKDETHNKKEQHMTNSHKLSFSLVALLGLYTLVWSAPSKSNLNMGGNKITGVADPVGDSDAVSKGYVDSGAGGASQWVRDHEGHLHPVATVGTQTWMADNLYVTTYPDGSEIVPTPPKYTAISYPSNITCGNGGTEVDKNSAKVSKFGILYEWDAIMNGSTTEGAQGICPTGWHIPTKSEVQTLLANLGSDSRDKLMAKGSGSSGWNAQYSGYYYINDPFFFGRCVWGDWWTSTTQAKSESSSFRIQKHNPEVVIIDSTRHYNRFPVRCIKD